MSCPNIEKPRVSIGRSELNKNLIIGNLMIKKCIDMTGKKFNDWTVIKFSHKQKGKYYWLSECICKNIKPVDGSLLRLGRSKKCIECHKKKTKVTHGCSKLNIPEYRAWLAIKQRCYNKKSGSYKYYGERGIKVCDRWLESFENFLKDMGKRPEKMSIDRINNHGNYEASNCKWSTAKEQRDNRRGRVNYKYGINIRNLSKSLNISYAILKKEIERNSFIISQSNGKHVST